MIRIGLDSASSGECLFFFLPWGVGSRDGGWGIRARARSAPKPPPLVRFAWWWRCVGVCVCVGGGGRGARVLGGLVL